MVFLLVQQDLRQRFTGNVLGAAWAVLAPLLQLLVFAVVFAGIFKARVPVGEWSPAHKTDDDLILARILWLEGAEPRNANTKDRYIYIHGTNGEEKIGQLASHGCIRLRNADVVELYDLVDVGTTVWIAE